MKKIEWNESLSIGIEFIDKDHQALLKRLNDVSDAVASHQGEREITRTLKFLSDYANQHFDAEEKKMTETDYPGLQEQIEEHKKFITTLNNLEEDFRYDDATKGLSEDLNNFLYNWLTHHIKEVDTKFGDYLQAKGL